MDWNEIQNLLSNIVFAVLLFAMVIYWVNLFFFRDKTSISIIGRTSTLIANILLFFILCSRWIVAGYFPLSNLYESLLFLTWTLLTVYLYIETQTKSRLIGAILIPTTLLINGFANLTLTPEMQKASPLVPALQSNWLMMHVSMMLLSYGTLIMGSLLCILFLVISRYQDVDLKMVDNSSLPLYNVMLDYYEAKVISSSNEILKFTHRERISSETQRKEAKPPRKDARPPGRHHHFTVSHLLERKHHESLLPLQHRPRRGRPVGRSGLRRRRRCAPDP